MKNFYSLVGAVAISASMFAQQNVKPREVKGETKITKNIVSQAKTATAAGDTVGRTGDFLPQFMIDNITVFGAPGGGTLYGKNGDSLNACAQYYQNLNNTALIISKVVLIVVDGTTVTSTAPSSYVKLTVYNGAPNKAYHIVGSALETSPTAKGPGTVLSTTNIPFAALQAGLTTDFVTVNLPSPVTVTGDLVLGLDARYLANGDTIGFASDAKGDGAGLNYALTTFGPPGSTATYKWLLANEFWTSGGAGVDNNIGVFAVLDAGTAVKEFYNGVKLADIFPNPATTNATINYTLEQDSKNVSLVVYDVTGKKVFDESYPTQASGSHSVSINTENFANGSYYYQLRANGALLTKEFIVTK